jgi:hypothetical protein
MTMNRRREKGNKINGHVGPRYVYSPCLIADSVFKFVRGDTLSTALCCNSCPGFARSVSLLLNHERWPCVACSLLALKHYRRP